MEKLTYEQARSIIEDGDIVFFHGFLSIKHPIESTIRIVTSSPFTHVNIAFWVEIAGQRRLMAVEAQGGTKRRIINMSHYSDKPMTVVKGLKPWNDIASDALSRIEIQRYSYVTAVYAGLRDFSMHRLGAKLPKMQHPGEICSEFCARMSGLPETDLSPGALYAALMMVTTEKK